MKSALLAALSHAFSALSGTDGKFFLLRNRVFVENRAAQFDKYKSLQTFRPANTTTAGQTLGVVVSSSGTVSHPTQYVTNLQSALRRTRWTSATTAGSMAGIYEAALTKVRGNASGIGGFRVEIVFSQGSNLAGHQYFVGIAASTAALGGDPSAVANTAGMGYDAADSATGNWQFMRNDGSGTATRVDLPACPRNTTDVYRVTMQADANGTGVNAKVENLTTGVTALDTTYTTDIPVNTQFVGMRAMMRNGATTSAGIIDVVSFDAGYQE